MTSERAIEARLRMFGRPPTPAELRVRARTPGSRFRRALLPIGAACLLAPLLALLPPHAVWFLGSLGGGAVLARRRWAERHTVTALRARCSHCEAWIEGESGVRLREPHPLACEACHHDGYVEFESADLPPAEEAPGRRAG